MGLYGCGDEGYEVYLFDVYASEWDLDSDGKADLRPWWGMHVLWVRWLGNGSVVVR